MPTKPKAAARKPLLPPVTVAKLDEAMLLMERLVTEHQATFIRHGQAYKDQHREGTRRPLTAAETAQIANAMNLTLVEAQQQVSEAGATVYDEPQGTEVLLAAGIATGTAFMHTAKQLTALIEMSDDDLEQACEADRLAVRLDEVVHSWRRVELGEMRTRVTVALEHFSAAAGFGSGKALALAGRAVWNGLWTAMQSLDAQGSGLSTLLPTSTAGGDERSSTASPGATS